MDEELIKAFSLLSIEEQRAILEFLEAFLSRDKEK